MEHSVNFLEQIGLCHFGNLVHFLYIYWMITISETVTLSWNTLKVFSQTESLYGCGKTSLERDMFHQWCSVIYCYRWNSHEHHANDPKLTETQTLSDFINVNWSVKSYNYNIFKILNILSLVIRVIQYRTWSTLGFYFCQQMQPMNVIKHLLLDWLLIFFLKGIINCNWLMHCKSRHRQILLNEEKNNDNLKT